MAQIVDWKKNCYKFVNMNAMALRDLLVLTLENSSKNYDYFNMLSMNQIEKMTILGSPRNQQH
jgi:hypothetical protein